MKNKYGIHLLITIFTGVLAWFVSSFIYKPLTTQLWQPLGITIYFCIVVLLIIVANLILSCCRGDIGRWFSYRSQETKEFWRYAVSFFLVFLVLSLSLEFVYEIGKVEISDPTSYIFLIDDSGSMAGNDPNVDRGKAIDVIMEKQTINIPYSVYRFSDKCELVRPMALYTGSEAYTFASNGGTDIVNSLKYVVEDIAKNPTIAGQFPKILLLSDGSASSAGVRSVIEMCNDRNIVVSTVSFRKFSNTLLNQIANKTGGVHLTAKDISSLYEQMEEGILSMSSRNLVSDRYVKNHDWIYGIMRVLFLIMIGAVWTVVKSCLYFGKNDFWNVFVFSVICASIAAILIELLYAFLSVDTAIARLILCVLWSITPGIFGIDKQPTRSSGDIFAGYTGETTYKSTGRGPVNKLK